MHNAVQLGARMPVAAQEEADKLRTRQERALRALDANALCPAPKRYLDGRVVHVKSEFSLLPQVKV